MACHLLRPAHRAGFQSDLGLCICREGLNEVPRGVGAHLLPSCLLELCLSVRKAAKAMEKVQEESKHVHVCVRTYVPTCTHVHGA